MTGSDELGGLSDHITETSFSVTDNTKGVLLAISSSIFIGGSFVIKKHALRRMQGRRASVFIHDGTYWARPN
jgi:hypothetical protein